MNRLNCRGRKREEKEQEARCTAGVKIADKAEREMKEKQTRWNKEGSLHHMC